MALRLERFRSSHYLRLRLVEVSAGSLIAVVAIYSLLFPSAAAAQTPNTWAGTWQTSWTAGANASSEVILSQTGTTVHGTYDHLNGTIQGIVTGDRFEGEWFQSNADGTFSLMLASDGMSWSGSWSDNDAGGETGMWDGRCASGPCLANRLTESAATPKDASITVVRCDRDATGINARFECTALVSAVEGAGRRPSGIVGWTTGIGAFTSGDSCTLRGGDVGVRSCTVTLEASNEEAPTGVALPVEATYRGDERFASSRGAHRLFGQSGGDGIVPEPPSTSHRVIPGWAIPLGGAGAAAFVAAMAWYFYSGTWAGRGAGHAGSPLSPGKAATHVIPDHSPDSTLGGAVMAEGIDADVAGSLSAELARSSTEALQYALGIPTDALRPGQPPPTEFRDGGFTEEAPARTPLPDD